MECLWQLLAERSALVPPAVFSRCSASPLVKSSSLSSLTKFRKRGKQQWVVIRTWVFSFLWFFFPRVLERAVLCFRLSCLRVLASEEKRGPRKERGIPDEAHLAEGP